MRLEAVSILICLLSCWTIAVHSARHIAFMKDAPLTPKCHFSVQNEPLQKPFVLLRLATAPLAAAEPEMAAVESVVNENEVEDEQEQGGQNSYTLIELSKAQVRKLIDSGKLKVSESDGANEPGAIMEVYNGDSENWLVDDERSKKRPWRKIQRIIRRQLIKYPKRYFRKIVHIIG